MGEKAFIAVGSNVEPGRYLPLAAARLRALGRVVAVSRVYQNAALGPTSQPDFLNAAVLVETPLAPLDVRDRLRAIEADLGRIRTADKYAPRTIDLDLCLYGGTVLRSPELTLPSPEITRRAYLAVTLAELAPDFPHPLTGEPLRLVADRLRPSGRLIACPDGLLCAASSG